MSSGISRQLRTEPLSPPLSSQRSVSAAPHTAQPTRCTRGLASHRSLCSTQLVFCCEEFSQPGMCNASVWVIACLHGEDDLSQFSSCSPSVSSLWNTKRIFNEIHRVGWHWVCAIDRIQRTNDQYHSCDRNCFPVCRYVIYRQNCLSFPGI